MQEVCLYVCISSCYTYRTDPNDHNKNALQNAESAEIVVGTSRQFYLTERKSFWLGQRTITSGVTSKNGTWQIWNILSDVTLGSVIQHRTPASYANFASISRWTFEHRIGINFTNDRNSNYCWLVDHTRVYDYKIFIWVQKSLVYQSTNLRNIRLSKQYHLREESKGLQCIHFMTAGPFALYFYFYIILYNF